MTTATMMKRIATKQKEIAKYQKEIARYESEKEEAQNKWHIDACTKWIAYYNKFIVKKETEIAEMTKQAAALASKEEMDAMIKAKAEEMATKGFKFDGLTTKGLRYSIYGNNGMTERSLHCYQMAIEGMGMVFTSGTLETVAEYILKN